MQNLDALQIRSIRELHDLHFGGPLIKLYVPEDFEAEGISVSVGTPETDLSPPRPGLPLPMDPEGGYLLGQSLPSLLLRIDRLFTQLGLWVESLLNPRFKQETDDLRARLSRFARITESTDAG